MCPNFYLFFLDKQLVLSTWFNSMKKKNAIYEIITNIILVILGFSSFSQQAIDLIYICFTKRT
jgi:hypothetical protein